MVMLHSWTNIQNPSICCYALYCRIFNPSFARTAKPMQSGQALGEGNPPNIPYFIIQLHMATYT